MVSLIISLGCVGVLLSGCHDDEVHHEESVKVRATSPARMDLRSAKDYVCQIRSIQHIDVRALEKGYLTEIYVDEGQFIKKDQPMFQIMPLLYQAELNKAKAEVKFADIEYRNTRQLCEKNVVSENELALAKARYEKAEAEMALAQVHLDLTVIKAPFDGLMNRFEVRLGSLVDEGELLTSLSDNSRMWVYFNVPEAEYLEYKKSLRDEQEMNVELLLADGTRFNQHGKVDTIVGDFNNATGNIAFRATFGNPDGLLRHGQTGNIQIFRELHDALVIPQKATYEVLDRRFVFVIDEENVLRQREIRVGEELDHLYVLESGLEDHERIVLEGLRHVKQGDEVEYEDVTAEEAMASLDLYAE